MNPPLSGSPPPQKFLFEIVYCLLADHESSNTLVSVVVVLTSTCSVSVTVFRATPSQNVSPFSCSFLTTLTYIILSNCYRFQNSIPIYLVSKLNFDISTQPRNKVFVWILRRYFWFFIKHKNWNAPNKRNAVFHNHLYGLSSLTITPPAPVPSSV